MDWLNYRRGLPIGGGHDWKSGGHDWKGAEGSCELGDEGGGGECFLCIPGNAGNLPEPRLGATCIGGSEKIPGLPGKEPRCVPEAMPELPAEP